MLVIRSNKKPVGVRGKNSATNKFERTFPGLNEYTRKNRANWRAGKNMKEKYTQMVAWEAKGQHLSAWHKPVKILFSWYEEDNRRDLDNIFSAKKFILDGLVEAGVIPDDGQKYVRGLRDEIFIDPRAPRVEIEITSAYANSWHEADGRR